MLEYVTLLTSMGISTAELFLGTIKGYAWFYIEEGRIKEEEGCRECCIFVPRTDGGKRYELLRVTLLHFDYK